MALPLPNTLRSALASYLAEDKRRARLIAFLDRSAEPDEFGVRIGPSRVSYGFLTTEVLEELRADVLREVWAARKRLRERRAEGVRREAA